MDGKRKVSSSETYVFTDEEREALDELSLTSVIGELTDSLEQSAVDEAHARSDLESARAAPESDSSIDDLLESFSTDGPAPEPPRRATPRDVVEEGSAEPSGDLLPPELMFPGTSDDADDA